LRIVGRVALGVLGVAICLSATRAAAQVSVEVQIIAASNSPGPGPSAIPHLQRDLQKAMKYSNYRLVERRVLTLAYAQSSSLTLPNKAILKLTPLALDPTSKMLRMRVQNALAHYDLDTEYSIKNGGTILVAAGPFQSGMMLVALTPNAP
jgi:hypothetical protein